MNRRGDDALGVLRSPVRRFAIAAFALLVVVGLVVAATRALGAL